MGFDTTEDNPFFSPHTAAARRLSENSYWRPPLRWLRRLRWLGFSYQSLCQRALKWCAPAPSIRTSAVPVIANKRSGLPMTHMIPPSPTSPHQTAGEMFPPALSPRQDSGCPTCVGCDFGVDQRRHMGERTFQWFSARLALRDSQQQAQQIQAHEQDAFHCAAFPPQNMQRMPPTDRQEDLPHRYVPECGRG
ncbi:hypothetical protein HPB50_022230 [Hyalomma asiaticum]|uniref:Uncharacterized protein n=1 Tax=Hyalomma asiaticum TaxID=266040 RepID=A0ACB7TPK9_HYAAI|nr:hypothetical protein HPB50_022230 [Hyalomma asiaticum]